MFHSLLFHCSIDDGDYGGDVGFAFFGIDDLEGKAEHVSKSGAEARQKEYEALQSSPDFTWEALLSHTFEEIECPSNSKSLVKLHLFLLCCMDFRFVCMLMSRTLIVWVQCFTALKDTRLIYSTVKKMSTVTGIMTRINAVLTTALCTLLL
eukprot:g8224.t1